MSQPRLLKTPFAENGLKNTIPDERTSGTLDEAATFNDGFPVITMTPIAAGGLPPSGQDFNGIFNAISAHTAYQNQGGRYQFDNDYAVAIGGYPKGAVLVSDDFTQEYVSLIDSNTYNFNTDLSSIGTYWAKTYATPESVQTAITNAVGRLINVQVFTASGTYTPTEGTKKIIVEAVGGGGSGASGAMNGSGFVSGGGGGASGCYAKALVDASGISSVSVTIGAGGASVQNANGNLGGNTSFGSYLTVYGGNQGLILTSTTSTPLFYGATGTRSAFGSISNATLIDFDCGNASGDAFIIAVGGMARGGFGAASRLGGATVGPGFNTAGNAATTYGSGGSGVVSNSASAYYSSGAGKSGVVIVWEYA